MKVAPIGIPARGRVSPETSELGALSSVFDLGLVLKGGDGGEESAPSIPVISS